MRTLPALLLFGCNTFTTVDEACSDSVAGANSVTRAGDLEIVQRMNCYRRVAKRPKGPVNPAVQEAVEGHRDWMEANAPDLTLFSQVPGTPGYTGNSALQRLDAAGYTMPANGALLEVGLWADASYGLPSGGGLFDFWFEDPFARPAWLQHTVLAVGASEGEYTVVYSPTLGLDDQTRQLLYFNVIYTRPSTPYAEPAVVYPRNGQVDVPPDYVHLLDATDKLEIGRTYGFPITFTVGVSETGLEVTQASLRRVDTSEAAVPFQVILGDTGFLSGLSNTVIMVPDRPLSTGATYQANARLKSDQGERVARTTFTVGGASRPVPGIATRAARDGVPVVDLWVRHAELTDLLPGEVRAR